MNEWISEITRGPSGSVRHAVSLFKLNNSTTYSQQESKSLPSLMNLDKREYCSYTSNIFKNTLYPVLPLTILHMKNNFSPNSHFWNLAWKPSLYGSSDDSSPTLLLAPFFCLFICSFVSLCSFLGPDFFHFYSLIPLLRFCFIKESWGLVPPAVTFFRQQEDKGKTEKTTN